jgi:hypothetical protein
MRSLKLSGWIRNPGPGCSYMHPSTPGQASSGLTHAFLCKVRHPGGLFSYPAAKCAVMILKSTYNHKIWVHSTFGRSHSSLQKCRLVASYSTPFTADKVVVKTQGQPRQDLCSSPRKVKSSVPARRQHESCSIEYLVPYTDSIFDDH